MIVGMDRNGPQLYYTDPSGSYSSWKANATGRNGVHIKEVLEKKWKENLTEVECKELVVKCLGEMVENGSKGMELLLITKEGIKFLKEDEVEEIFKKVTAEGLEEEK